jgi:hypothetical protein
MFKAKDITNQRFGNLVAKERVEKNKYNEWRWRCTCDCGRETVTSLRNLVHGHVKSCAKCNSFTFEGKTQTIGEWSKETGLRHDTLFRRIYTYNWSYEDALSPVKGRVNASQERRLVMLAIESISSTKLARERGLGASMQDIIDYTKLKKNIVNSAIEWLRKKGCIFLYRRGQWRVRDNLHETFCFKHGITEQFGNKCLKCVQENGG